LVILSAADSGPINFTFGSGTSIAVIVTSTAILVGADSKIAWRTGPESTSSVPSSTKPKIFLLPNGIVMGSAGFGTFAADSKTIYDPEDWILETGKEFQSTTSVTEFANKVKAKVALTFANFDELIKHGIVTPEGFKNPIISYVIAGFDGNSTAVYTIDMNADWEHSTMFPPILQFKYPRTVFNGKYPYLLFLGSSIAANQISTRQGYFYDKALGIAPNELRILSEGKDFSIAQAAKLLHTFIQLEGEANPRAVGPPIRIITLPSGGKPTVTEN